MNNSEADKIKDTLVKYLSSGKIEEGLAFFKARANEIPEIFRLECLGTINFYQRNIGQAITFYEAATLLAPEHVISRYLYLAGVKNEREENFVTAFEYYQAAIEAEPSFIDPYVELGGLLMKVGDFEGALRCYEDAVQLDFHDPANHENLKTVLNKLNQSHPNCYEDKLQAANTAYAKLLLDGQSKPMPQKHSW